ASSTRSPSASTVPGRASSPRTTPSIEPGRTPRGRRALNPEINHEIQNDQNLLFRRFRPLFFRGFRGWRASRMGGARHGAGVARAQIEQESPEIRAPEEQGRKQGGNRTLD